MPGVLEVDAILQLCGFFLSHVGYAGYGRALRTGKIVFREQVRPHHKLVTYKIDFKKITGKPTPAGVRRRRRAGRRPGLGRGRRHHGRSVHRPEATRTHDTHRRGDRVRHPQPAGPRAPPRPPPHCVQAAPASSRCGPPGPSPACAPRSPAWSMPRRCARTSTASRSRFLCDAALLAAEAMNDADRRRGARDEGDRGPAHRHRPGHGRRREPARCHRARRPRPRARRRQGRPLPGAAHHGLVADRQPVDDLPHPRPLLLA